ncbi:probable serine/threonine-protein kinase clkA [Oppia nitens]|uniref:probable serine/threonine-protein kinase clkA n=1 Tax=Oppia nitens TaxID=1686743 RepID=UPI0023DAF989|nr:probable serine/threonine-protein kinase clkA [Oppia nitens]
MLRINLIILVLFLTFIIVVNCEVNENVMEISENDTTVEKANFFSKLSKLILAKGLNFTFNLITHNNDNSNNDTIDGYNNDDDNDNTNNVINDNTDADNDNIITDEPILYINQESDITSDSGSNQPIISSKSYKDIDFNNETELFKDDNQTESKSKVLTDTNSPVSSSSDGDGDGDGGSGSGSSSSSHELSTTSVSIFEKYFGNKANDEEMDNEFEDKEKNIVKLVNKITTQLKHQNNDNQTEDIHQKSYHRKHNQSYDDNHQEIQDDSNSVTLKSNESNSLLVNQSTGQSIEDNIANITSKIDDDMPKSTNGSIFANLIDDNNINVFYSYALIGLFFSVLVLLLIFAYIKCDNKNDFIDNNNKVYANYSNCPKDEELLDDMDVDTTESYTLSKSRNRKYNSYLSKFKTYFTSHID